MRKGGAAAANARDVRQARRQRRAEVTDPDVVMEAAAAFLAVRPRSVGETRTRLATLGYRRELVEQVVDRFVSIGYLDDETFARAWVESRDRARPRGEHALRLELIRKGIDRQTIDLVLAERVQPISNQRGGPSEPGFDGGNSSATGRSPDMHAATRLLERRSSALERERDPRKRRAKAYALLARNGFGPDVSASVSAAWAADLGDRETSVDLEEGAEE